MKAIILAGGQGTRLRPLTLHTPKPVVPIFDRPFLRYQIDLLRQVPEIDEIVLSLNYRPEAIEQVFGDGSALGIRLRYAVEPEPLGTGGAIRFAAGQASDDAIVVFNGDVFTAVDLPAVIALHRQRRAQATIVLTPVENPAAYGLVETDREGNIQDFIEKPDPDEIRCDTINAGIYVLEPGTLDRIPPGISFSIERGYFPSLVRDKARFVAYIYRGYWIDIGTSEKYVQAHRDIMNGRFVAPPFEHLAGKTVVAPGASIAEGAHLHGPCFIDRDAVVEPGASIGPYSVVGAGCRIGPKAIVTGSVLWPGTRVDEAAQVIGAVIGQQSHIGAEARVAAGTVLGDRSIVTDYSRLGRADA
jgi:NDP-sugar pyrophosphorylase family protein